MTIPLIPMNILKALSRILLPGAMPLLLLWADELPSPGFAAAATTAASQARQQDIESFEYVWRTIRDKHWDPRLGGLDWEAVYHEFRPRVEASESIEQSRQLMNEMISRLGQSHFGVVPSMIYREMGGNASDALDYPAGAGESGLDVRCLDGHILVTSVYPDYPAGRLKIEPGWEIVKIRDRSPAALVEKIEETYRDSTQLQYHLRRAILARLSGDIGEQVPVSFLDGRNEERTLRIGLSRPRGNRVGFGHLPPQFVWIERRMLEEKIGYVAFNFFLDPTNVMREFGDAVQSFRHGAGIIIDLRGNPGGIGAMSMGMAGWFISEPGKRLGTMYMRDTNLKFVVIPRAATFSGPLAILVDGCSVSTSEIFAGGLQDLGRARIFGSRTAGAALPSVFERLPNGDGFQYAVANYLSEGGRPLEGRGVTPDEEVALTRAALLSGTDPVLEKARAWILRQAGHRLGVPHNR